MKTKNRPPETTHRAETTRPQTRTVREAGKLLLRRLVRSRTTQTELTRGVGSSQTELWPAFEQTDPVVYRRSHTERLHAKGVNVGERAPLLNAQQVSEQLGFDSSANLQAVIDLPTKAPWVPYTHKPLRLFVFYESPSTGRHTTETPQYTVMTATQIRQLQQHKQTGWPRLEDIHRNTLRLSATTDTLSKKQAIIGRDHWLPDVGSAEWKSLDPDMRARYENVSRTQALLSLDEQGDLHIRDLESKNGTSVTYGPVLGETQATPVTDPWASAGYPPAVDPWEGAGIGDTMHRAHSVMQPGPDNVGADPWANHRLSGGRR